MCERAMTTTTTTAAPAPASGGLSSAPAPAAASPSSSGGSSVSTDFVYTEMAEGKRWNNVNWMPDGTYNSGQECCTACAASNQGFKWASVGLVGSAKEGKCGCKHGTNEPNLKNTDGDTWSRGSCKLPVEYAYSEIGNANRFHGGQTPTGTYSNGQECCDICYASKPGVDWVTFVTPGSSTPAECKCIDSNLFQPSLKNVNVQNYADWNYGSCKNKYTYSGRKKRETLQLQDLMLDSVLPILELSQRRYKRETSEGVETQDEIDKRSYGSKLRYECGKARRFYDPELEELYDERTIQCNWNNTWTRHDYIDECVWTQCLYPPPTPEGYLLTTTWSGDPVEFYDNATYVCDGEDLYFEWDRQILEFNVTCLPGGAWELPDEWPRCVPCRLIRMIIHVDVDNDYLFSCKLH